MNTLARYISIIGHPLFTIPVFIAIVMFRFENFSRAVWISLLIIGGVFVPVIWRMYTKSRNGSYTNFDVSDQIQRRSLFGFAIPLLAIVTAVLFLTDQPKNLSISVLFAFLLVAISSVVNLFVKSSLHVSLNIYLSALLFPIDYRIAIVVFLFTILVGWSRVKLGRHTKKEVLFGSLIGAIISLVMLYIQ